MASPAFAIDKTEVLDTYADIAAAKYGENAGGILHHVSG
jgi:hypothetical protein